MKFHDIVDQFVNIGDFYSIRADELNDDKHGLSGNPDFTRSSSPEKVQRPRSQLV
jgi:hypothetical protein